MGLWSGSCKVPSANTATSGRPLLSPVVKYGFTWEVESGPNAESWHIRYVCGDEWPSAVDEALKVFPDLRA